MINILRPNGQGSINSAPGYPNEVNWASTNYNDVNEETVNDATFFGTHSSGGLHTYGSKSFSFPDIASISEIQNLVITFRINGAVGAVTGARPYVYIGGTVFYGSEVASPDSGFLTFTYAFTTNPSTGLKWTLSDINALDAGVWMEALSSGNSQCTCSWYYVTITSLDPISGSSQIVGLCG